MNQIESGNPFTISSDRFYLLRETTKGKRLVRNAKVKILNHQLTNRDIDIATNSIGFRYSELSSEKPATEKRVLFLGDSVTLNNYLPEDETFTRIAEKIINDNSRRLSYQFINAGVEDIGITEEMEILKEDGLSIKPDAVVINFYLNDSRPPWGFEAEQGHPGWIRRYSFAVQWILNRYQLSSWFTKTGTERMKWVNDQYKYKWWLSENELRSLAKSAAYDWGAAWEQDSWTVVDQKLAELKNLSEKFGFRVVVIAFPVEFQLRANFIDDLPQKKLSALAQKYNFLFLDLLPTLRQSYLINHPIGKEPYLDQAHLTTFGNEVVAEVIAKFFSQHLIDKQAQFSYDNAR